MEWFAGNEMIRTVGQTMEKTEETILYSLETKI